MLTRLLAMVALFVGLGSHAVAAAEALPQPSGAVVLAITGNIASKNGPDGVEFDMAMLDSLPQTNIKTYTEWTEGMQTFEGVLLSDLMKAVGAEGDTIVASAIPGYTAPIPWSDLKDYTVLVATRHNGERMSIRQKGPLWIIYQDLQPPSDNRRLNTDKMVWQLNKLKVE